MVMLDELDEKLMELEIQSSKSRLLFKERAVMKTFQKNDHIFLEGDANACEYLLLRGVLHRYNVSDKGEMVTTGFYMGKNVVTPHFARVNDHKCIFSLQALTESVIAEIPVAALNELRFTNREFQLFGQKIVQAELAKIFFFESVCRSYPAKERLLILRKHFPNLENLVPHHTIASFLGITQVSFSRLRHELSVK
jgi:CRP-like cAMP-binding protein